MSYTFSFRNVHVLSHLGHNVSQDCLNKISALCPCERLYSASVKLTFMQLTQTDGFQHIHLAAFLFAVKHGGWQTALGWNCFPSGVLDVPNSCFTSYMTLHCIRAVTQHVLRFSLSTHKHSALPSQSKFFWKDLKVVFWICAKTGVKKTLLTHSLADETEWCKVCLSVKLR